METSESLRSFLDLALHMRRLLKGSYENMLEAATLETVYLKKFAELSREDQESARIEMLRPIESN